MQLPKSQLCKECGNPALQSNLWVSKTTRQVKILPKPNNPSSIPKHTQQKERTKFHKFSDAYTCTVACTFAHTRVCHAFNNVFSTPSEFRAIPWGPTPQGNQSEHKVYLRGEKKEEGRGAGPAIGPAAPGSTATTLDLDKRTA